ncbi:fasciclin domain-containing protein [bacterium]|nr:fasciclin domain-containing protein [bacterium]
MKFHNWVFGALSVLAIGFSGIGCSEDDDNNNNTPALGTIADRAAADPELTSLVAALQATGLDALVDDPTQRLTVFAPTNAAFDQLLSDLGLTSLDELVSTLGVDAVTNIVAYHVLATEQASGSLTTSYANTLGTAAGTTDEYLSLFVNTASGVKINEANVTAADIEADNGVIHKIDKVLLPLGLVELLQINPNYSTLVAAVLAADPAVLTAVNDPNANLTVLAPNNAAFTALLAALGVNDLAGVIGAIGQDGLTTVLLYHAIPSVVYSSDLTNGPVATAAAQNVTVDLSSGVRFVDTNGDAASVTVANVRGTNGIIHGINAVLLPQL